MKNGRRSFNAALAMELGLNEAILLQQIQYWMKKSRGRTISGRKWVYLTHDQIKDQFPFWSVSTIRRTVASLKTQNKIETKKEYELLKSSRAVLHYSIVAGQDDDQNEHSETPDISQKEVSIPSKEMSDVSKMDACYNNTKNTTEITKEYVLSVSEDKKEPGAKAFPKRSRYTGGELLRLYQKAKDWLEEKAADFQNYVRDYIKSSMRHRVIQNKLAYARTILIEIWKKETNQLHNTSFHYDAAERQYSREQAVARMTRPGLCLF